MKLTHVNEQGEAHMVDVGAKPVVMRSARAKGFVTMAPSTLAMIESSEIPKGDVFAVARVAAIMAAKQTAALIPLCHPIALEQIAVDFEKRADGVQIDAAVRCHGRTGVEMEALTAVSVAALTLYDMCKAVDKAMVIGPIRLVEKVKDEL